MKWINNMVLSRHFTEKWKKRFGCEPNLDEIMGIIKSKPWVSKCRDIKQKNGEGYRVLSVYVDFERKVAVKVDEIDQKIVTLITDQDRIEEFI